MISDQIIQVLDAIAERMGVAINWTADNVMPYVQQLCAKYITYAMAQSIAAAAMAGIVTLVTWRIAAFLHKKAVAVNYDDRYGRTALAVVAWFLLIISGIAFLVLFYIMANTVITCMAFPEKIILEFVQSFLAAS